MIFEAPFDLILITRSHPVIDPALYRLLLVGPLLLVEITTLLLLRLSPMVRLTRATFFSFALMLGVFAVWALCGFGFPSAPLPTALNIVSKILAFATALTLFLPQRPAPEQAPPPAGPRTRSAAYPQIARSASLPSGSARVHQPGAWASLTIRPPAASAASIRACTWSCGT